MKFPQPDTERPRYRGRFAPTPSGPLHLGSLLTALASWLDARVAGGDWLLRIDDLDAPRCPPGAADLILRQLESHGLHWDETPRRQSEHVEAYEQAYEQLRQSQRVYACGCTRATLAAESRPGPDGPVYSGRCRETATARTGPSTSSRLRLAPQRTELDDPVQGLLVRNVATEIGDFVLRRADGLIGYQLACVIDEAAQGITQVLRGADLIGSSLRQRLLQAELGLPSPAYLHLPVLTEADGRKLSKQNGASALDSEQARDNLERCLRLLGQVPPPAGLPTHELLQHALQHWQRARIPRQYSLPAQATG